MRYEIIINAKSGKDADKIRHDLEAKNIDDARSKVFKWLKGSNKLFLFDEITIVEVPDGPAPIGVRFSYTDINRNKFLQYLIIKAESKEQAKEYYNNMLLGKHFYQPWPDKIDEDGKCIYGPVEELYYAACPGWHFDATSSNVR